MKPAKPIPFHPLFLGIYPVLALLAFNVQEIRVSTGYRSLLLSFLGALLLFLLIRLFTRSWHRAALLTSLFLITFFSYGHVYALLKDVTALGQTLGRHRFLLPLSLILLSLGVWFILRKLKNPESITPLLNWISLLLLVFPAYQIISFQLRDQAYRSPDAIQLEGLVSLEDVDPNNLPDIYYIILDAYARDDTLQSVFGFDNTAFLTELADIGFYVASCSQSNYAQTLLSLSSSLNMDYLENYFDRGESGSEDRAGLKQLVIHSKVRKILEALGYQTVAFETGVAWTEWDDADIYLAPSLVAGDRSPLLGRPNKFETLLLKSTAAIIFTDATVKIPGLLIPNYDDIRHRERVLFALEQLANLPDTPEPKFIFAHIVSPHDPFVFGPNGEEVSGVEDQPRAYTDQITYLNARVAPLLSHIIASSETPPVIILQADHGGIRTSNRDRMNILNAYFLPEAPSPGLYQGISPVNSFRLVFNTYFSGDFEQLDDLSYFSIYQYPYDFEVIPETRPGCEAE